jgi:cyanophycinase-like exopeptidase
LLETPAGFELNSLQVSARIGDFLRHHLRNFDPQIEIVAARKKNTPNSPDNAEILSPLLEADLIFMGPGSPTYAVRQLKDSLAWNYLLAKHSMGTAIALASAATVAVSAFALPVYEIYKVGEELHWKNGLDLFGLYDLSLVFVPHWNNNDGGSELDTSRCYMGRSRFQYLLEMLPQDVTVIGIDEKTGLILFPESGICKVIGQGSITIIHAGAQHEDTCVDQDIIQAELHMIADVRQGHVHNFVNGESFKLERIGSFQQFNAAEGLPPGVLEVVRNIAAIDERVTQDENPTEAVMRIMEDREKARAAKNWSEADKLRGEIERLGWSISDSQDGPVLRRL